MDTRLHWDALVNEFRILLTELVTGPDKSKTPKYHFDCVGADEQIVVDGARNNLWGDLLLLDAIVCFHRNRVQPSPRRTCNQHEFLQRVVQTAIRGIYPSVASIPTDQVCIELVTIPKIWTSFQFFCDDAFQRRPHKHLSVEKMNKILTVCNLSGEIELPALLNETVRRIWGGMLQVRAAGSENIVDTQNDLQQMPRNGRVELTQHLGEDDEILYHFDDIYLDNTERDGLFGLYGTSTDVIRGVPDDELPEEEFLSADRQLSVGCRGAAREVFTVNPTDNFQLEGDPFNFSSAVGWSDMDPISSLSTNSMCSATDLASVSLLGIYDAHRPDSRHISSLTHSSSSEIHRLKNQVELLTDQVDRMQGMLEKVLGHLLDEDILRRIGVTDMMQTSVRSKSRSSGIISSPNQQLYTRNSGKLKGGLQGDDVPRDEVMRGVDYGGTAVSAGWDTEYSRARRVRDRTIGNSDDNMETSATGTKRPRTGRDRAYWAKLQPSRKFGSWCSPGRVVGVHEDGVGPPSTLALLIVVCASQPDTLGTLPEFEDFDSTYSHNSRKGKSADAFQPSASKEVETVHSSAQGTFVAVAVVGEVPVIIDDDSQLDTFRRHNKSEFLYVDKTGNVGIWDRITTGVRIFALALRQMTVFDENNNELMSFQGVRGVRALISHQVESEARRLEQAATRNLVDTIDGSVHSLQTHLEKLNSRFDDMETKFIEQQQALLLSRRGQAQTFSSLSYSSSLPSVVHIAAEEGRDATNVAVTFKAASLSLSTSSQRMYLDCPSRENEYVKKLGAKFDTDQKQWYVPPDTDLRPFRPWFLDCRTLLHCPYAERMTVKRLGAQWNGSKWYVRYGYDISLFRDWISSECVALTPGWHSEWQQWYQRYGDTLTGLFTTPSYSQDEVSMMRLSPLSVSLSSGSSLSPIPLPAVTESHVSSGSSLSPISLSTVTESHVSSGLSLSPISLPTVAESHVSLSPISLPTVTESHVSTSSPSMSPSSSPLPPLLPPPTEVPHSCPSVSITATSAGATTGYVARTVGGEENKKISQAEEKEAVHQSSRPVHEPSRSPPSSCSLSSSPSSSVPSSPPLLSSGSCSAHAQVDFLVIINIEASCAPSLPPSQAKKLLNGHSSVSSGSSGSSGSNRSGADENKSEFKSGWRPEIVQFPMAAYNTATRRIVSEFNEFVKPERFPQLSEFALEITGVEQSEVDSADSFPAAFTRAVAWIHDFASAHPQRSIALVTCGNWGLGAMLPAQATLSGIQLEDDFKYSIFKSWINIQDVYGNVRVVHMLDQLGLPAAEGRTTGIYSCRNIASIIGTQLDRGVPLVRCDVAREVDGDSSKGGTRAFTFTYSSLINRSADASSLVASTSHDLTTDPGTDLANNPATDPAIDRSTDLATDADSAPTSYTVTMDKSMKVVADSATAREFSAMSVDFNAADRTAGLNHSSSSSSAISRDHNRPHTARNWIPRRSSAVDVTVRPFSVSAFRIASWNLQTVSSRPAYCGCCEVDCSECEEFLCELLPARHGSSSSSSSSRPGRSEEAHCGAPTGAVATEASIAGGSWSSSGISSSSSSCSSSSSSLFPVVDTGTSSAPLLPTVGMYHIICLQEMQNCTNNNQGPCPSCQAVSRGSWSRPTGLHSCCKYNHAERLHQTLLASGYEGGYYVKMARPVGLYWRAETFSLVLKKHIFYASLGTTKGAVLAWLSHTSSNQQILAISTQLSVPLRVEGTRLGLLAEQDTRTPEQELNQLWEKIADIFIRNQTICPILLGGALNSVPRSIPGVASSRIYDLLTRFRGLSSVYKTVTGREPMLSDCIFYSRTPDDRPATDSGLELQEDRYGDGDGESTWGMIGDEPDEDKRDNLSRIRSAAVLDIPQGGSEELVCRVRDRQSQAIDSLLLAADFEFF